jgi:phage shock protein A
MLFLFVNDVHEREDEMLTTLRTLILGANARAEQQVRKTYAIELIDEKLRQSETGLRAAKGTLVTLIGRARAEQRNVDILSGRITDLTARAVEAQVAGQDTLVADAADAIATMENELALRRETLARLEARTQRLRQSVEATHRRIIDLRQGAISARAMRQEQAIQTRLNTTLAGQSPMAEAEDLIAGVLGADDPGEQAEILAEIDRGLDHTDVADRMAAQGYGKPTKITAADVMARLRTTN